ncbi:hypothetical protein NYE54_08040 [Paenibacillus sp. FSL K6-1330]|uniref:hypothetical protein n=1 Tax=Paenibacillus sp. FSL K6-1330 TaxID=2975292 RepID=UPI0030DD7DF3
MENKTKVVVWLILAVGIIVLGIHHEIIVMTKEQIWTALEWLVGAVGTFLIGDMINGFSKRPKP